MKRSEEGIRRMAIIGPGCKYAVTGIGVCVEAFIDGVKNQGIEVLHVDTGSKVQEGRVGGWSIGKGFQQALKIFEAIWAANRSDVVYLTLASSKFGAMRDSLIVRLARLNNKPVVGQLHGGGFRELYDSSTGAMRWVLRNITANLSDAIVLTESLRSQFEGLVAPENLHVVSNGILPPLRDSQVEEKMRLPDCRPIELLYLSNLIISKGYIEAIEATRILRDQYNQDVVLNICGEIISIEGAENKSSGSVKEMLNQQDFVKYHGVVSGKKKLRILEKSSILVFPTTYPWEGQPVCIIEAMASGIPVVTTFHKGIPDMLEPDVEGILLEKPDPHEIARRIDELIRDKEQFRSIACAARERFDRSFTLQGYINGLTTICLSRTEPQM